MTSSIDSEVRLFRLPRPAPRQFSPAAGIVAAVMRLATLGE